ncbi:15174_t:CDS:2 [Gigaspora margarita]|uniref:15174_t:CDS:1 n=1 Tax=Gigaspora margarita TaxID=4874 RepID=A0ABM8W3Z2_GIGMA|nr:15174_t:CDS:2 [Gigaspora margarita]
MRDIKPSDTLEIRVFSLKDRMNWFEMPYVKANNVILGIS